MWLMAYFDTGWSWLSGAPQKKWKSLHELLLTRADREALAGPASAEGRSFEGVAPVLL